LDVLAYLSEKRALVPTLWYYEVGNGLIMAYRRKRITLDKINGFMIRLNALPIESAYESAAEILRLPELAFSRSLTNYDAAYLALADRFHLPLATNDADLRRAAGAIGVKLLSI
jgi:predicted nucleic acid-binding protein